MAAVTHVYTGEGEPTEASPAPGAHYIDTLAGDSWESLGPKGWRRKAMVIVAAGDPAYADAEPVGTVLVSPEESAVMHVALSTHLGFVTLPGFKVGTAAPDAPGETFVRFHFNPATGRLSINSGSAWYHVDLTETT